MAEASLTGGAQHIPGMSGMGVTSALGMRATGVRSRGGLVDLDEDSAQIKK